MVGSMSWEDEIATDDTRSWGPHGLPPQGVEPSSVDLTPTWQASMEILIMVMENGTPEGKEIAKAELRDVAQRLDLSLTTPAPELQS
jgi:hypothetical protein